MKVDLGLIRKCIDNEEDFTDEIPDEIWEHIQNDRDFCKKMLILTVIETKNSIKNRLADALTDQSNIMHTNSQL